MLSFIIVNQRAIISVELSRNGIALGGEFMVKVLIGPSRLIYPMPVLLFGVNVNDKQNFMTVAWGGIANGKPPMISIALNHTRYTLEGIKQTGVFSINIPSISLLKEADYCGIVSGSKVNKAETCKFKVFYGKLKNAPLIEQCPVNLECEVVHILYLGSHSFIIGSIKETHVSEDCLTNGEPDFKKIKPLVWITDPASQYCIFGDVVAKALSVGRSLKEG
jgi:flavin reductase (DIM6/NTAB) family NADH-FMN oxidoreductase RutF